jgi:parallel beta-helix repeat protein
MKVKSIALLCLAVLVSYSMTATHCCLSYSIAFHKPDVADGLVSVESGYDESLPIHITDNDDFAAQASSNSWNGSGSLIDPYVIEGLNITVSATSPIQIGNTTVFFEVRGCLLVGGPIGILLQNVTNAKVWNNTIQSSVSSGLLITESDNVLATNNSIQSITGADSTGIYSLGSDYCEFSNNTIQSVDGWGILADYSDNCSITENDVNESSNDGIRLRDSSETNITLNVVTHSDMSGIKLGNSHRCRLERNLVGHSLADGISIEASADSIIQDNVLYESGGYSLDVAGDSADIIANTFYRSQMQGLRCQSDNNYVTQNNFIENNLLFSGSATYLDHTGTSNDIAGNYYDIWTWPDLDENDIVDRPYQYGLVVAQSDNEPHVKVFLTDLMHVLTKPRLIYPNESMTGEKFWGLVQISWSIASDTFGHDVTYNVSVSTDMGSSWIEIADGLTDTLLDWNSSEFAESPEYRFKVVAQCSNGLVSEYVTSAMYEVASHTLSAPTVLTPNGGETIVGDCSITWTESVESWGLEVAYDVFFSADAGETWTEILRDTQGTEVYWNVRGLSLGEEYLIRVIARSSSGLVAEDMSDSVFSIARLDYSIVIIVGVGGAIAIAIAVYAVRRRGAA